MPEPPETADLVRFWLEKAEHDLLNIENNVAAKNVPWDTVAYHAQQCAEKYLKALLTFLQIEFPKTHDLTELNALLPKNHVLDIEPRTLERLNPYSIEGRYPGVWEPIEREEALQAVEGARAVRGAIRKVLPPELVG